MYETNNVIEMKVAAPPILFPETLFFSSNFDFKKQKSVIKIKVAATSETPSGDIIYFKY
jgi:hypothetical protein